MAPVDISVVIPAYFGASTIATCLASLEKATAGRRAEIIVVESSGDETAEIVAREFPDVVVVRSPQRLSAGEARNRGAGQAHGRLIFFTDQDCTVSPDWVARLERHLDDPSVGAAGGSVGIEDLSNLSGCAVYFLEFLNHFPTNRPPRRDKNFLVGCNSLYRPEALRAVRFPDQTLGEDVIFSHELLSKGFGVIYDASIEVRHRNRTGWVEFLRYNRKMGQSAAIYHGVLRRWWISPFFRMPTLAFLAPVIILPSIGMDLLRSRWSYFWRFLMLSPLCLVGNLVWARAFRQQVLRARRTEGVNVSRPTPS